MSLYNMVCGNNPLYNLFLAVLSTTEKFPPIPRFRDAYVDLEGDNAPTIVIYTRTGGGNREAYEGDNDAMTLHPLYLGDWDDEFDSTFAYFRFAVPEKYKAQIKEIQEGLKNHPKFITPSNKFKMAMDIIEGKPQAASMAVDDKEAERIGELVEKLATDLGIVS